MKQEDMQNLIITLKYTIAINISIFLYDPNFRSNEK